MHNVDWILLTHFLFLRKLLTIYIFLFNEYVSSSNDCASCICYDDDITGIAKLFSASSGASNNIYTRHFEGTWSSVTFNQCYRKTMSSTSAGTAQNSYLIPIKVIGLSFGLNNFGIADYVVEQGENENWAWKKWNSGVAELYGYGTVTGTSPTSLMSGYYSYGNTIAYPFSLTEYAFSANSNAKLGTGLGWSNIVADKNFATIYCVGNQNSNQITYTCIIRGRWK